MQECRPLGCKPGIQVLGDDLLVLIQQRIQHQQRLIRLRKAFARMGQLSAQHVHGSQEAIVAAVGRKMAYRPGVSGKIFAKLGETGVNIRMITQGPEELNIIVGVEEKDFEQAIRVLYDSFVKEKAV